MSTVEERIAALEAKQLRRELPESIAAALEQRPKEKATPTQAGPDKEANRTAVWNAVQALPGWEKAPGGARYVGARGVAMLVGKAGAFSAGGTSSPSKQYDTLEAAVEAAQRIGGTAKKRAGITRGEDEEVQEEGFVDEGLKDRARDAVAQALAGEVTETEEERDGLMLKKRLVKVEIPVDDLAEAVHSRCDTIQKEEGLSEEEAMARAVDELVPKLPGRNVVAEGEEDAAVVEVERAVGEEEVPAEAEAPAEESGLSEEEQKLADNIAAKAAELIEGGEDPEAAVHQAIEAALKEEEKPEEEAPEEPEEEEDPKVPAQ